MKKDLRMRVIAEFEAQLAALEPPFSLANENQTDNHDECFRCVLNQHRYGFILVLFSPRGENKFTVELAYSTEPVFPYHVMPDLPVDIPSKQQTRGSETEGAFRFRIGFLLPSRQDVWFEIGHPSSAEPVVSEIVGAIEEFGISLLRNG